jgi:hypothetical protein
MAQNNGIRTVLAPPGQAVLAVGKLARKFLAIENIINYWGATPNRLPTEAGPRRVARAAEVKSDRAAR